MEEIRNNGSEAITENRFQKYQHLNYQIEDVSITYDKKYRYI